METAGSTGFRIYFESRDDRVCWEHGRCTIYIYRVKKYTKYSGLKQDFSLAWMKYSVMTTPPHTLLSFHAHFQISDD